MSKCIIRHFLNSASNRNHWSPFISIFIPLMPSISLFPECTKIGIKVWLDLYNTDFVVTLASFERIDQLLDHISGHLFWLLSFGSFKMCIDVKRNFNTFQIIVWCVESWTRCERRERARCVLNYTLIQNYMKSFIKYIEQLSDSEVMFTLRAMRGNCWVSAGREWLYSSRG